MAPTAVHPGNNRKAQEQGLMLPKTILRKFLNRFDLYRRLRRMQAEGWAYNLRRWYLLRRILETPSISTRPMTDGNPAACEVHIMTYEVDWLMALWAAKSFYHFAQVDWPLIWHQGGTLKNRSRDLLGQHFPDSRFISMAQADATVQPELTRQKFSAAADARRHSVLLRKLIDYVLFGNSPQILNLDSDILFFRRPQELVDAVISGRKCNVYNRDLPTTFNLIPDESAWSRYQIRPLKGINSGLALFYREAISLRDIDRYLRDPDLRIDTNSSSLTLGLIEQSLHGLLAARFSAELLPSTYLVSLDPGLEESGKPVVAKHYAGGSRRLMFEEGLPALIERGFLEKLNHNHGEDHHKRL